MLETIPIDEDYSKEEIREIRKDARAGNIGAMQILADIYNDSGAYEKALVYEERMMEKGSSIAATSAAEKYLYGLGTEKDYEKAVAYYEIAREAGDTDADLALVLMKIHGIIDSEDREESIADLKAYAEKGYRRAQENLAVLLTEGCEMKRNLPEAWTCYQNLYDEMDPKSLLMTGRFLVRYGDSVGEKPETGFRYIKKAALMADEEAIMQTGICYMSGFGVKKNLTHAIRWFEKLEEGLVPERDVCLGLACYERGEAGDGEKALASFKKAEENASMAGAYMGIRCVLEGVGTEKNEKKGKSLLRAEAEDGNPLCARHLADWYRDGIIYKENCKTAATWYRKAFEGGNISAGTELAKLYFYGRGVKKNIHKAGQYFCDAGNSGDTEAQVFLENCYREGIELKKDPSLADLWKEFRLETQQKMTCRYPEAWKDILECEREAERWQKKQQ